MEQPSRYVTQRESLKVYILQHIIYKLKKVIMLGSPSSVVF